MGLLNQIRFSNNLRRRAGGLLVWSGLIILFYFSTVGWIWQSGIAKKNREGARLYNDGRIDEALSKWRDAQIDSPDRKELHYNIGGALHQQKKYEEAFNEYEKSLDSKDTELQSKAYYNIGNTHYRMGKLLEAIEDYKKCLDINPDDEDAKYNIEFIRRKIKENLEKEKMQKEIQQEMRAQQQRMQEAQLSEKEEELEMKEGESIEGKEAEEKEGEEERSERKEEFQEEKEGEMSEEDAIRLLDALKDDEKELQKKLRAQPGPGRYRVDKDW